jgi:hypothetical protein
MSRIRSLLRNLLQPELVDRELDDDLRAYQRLLIEEKCASGLSEEDAVREAALEIGPLQAVKERVREVRMGWTLETTWRDVRYSVRGLRRAPGFTAASIVILSLGIGANTAVFSIFSAALLRPLPYAGEDRIVAISEKRLREDSARSSVSVADFLDWRNVAKNFESIALYESTRQMITSGDQVELAPSARVTAGFFEALGVHPLLGRTFGVADEDPGGRRVAILSYKAWRLRFGGDRDILGRLVTIGGEPAEVVGVLPEAFLYPFAARGEFFEPMRFTTAQRRYRGIHPYDGIGRLRESVTFEQARAEMEVISKQLESQYPETNAGHVANLVPLRQELTGRMQSTLAILMGAGVLLILIACANVASLLLARASARKRETALRLALGCDRRLATDAIACGEFDSVHRWCRRWDRLGGLGSGDTAFTVLRSAGLLCRYGPRSHRTGLAGCRFHIGLGRLEHSSLRLIFGSIRVASCVGSVPPIRRSRIGLRRLTAFQIGASDRPSCPGGPVACWRGAAE